MSAPEPSVALLLVILVILERLIEIVIARRNARRLFEQGAIEHGAGHHPFMVLLHGAWLVSTLLYVMPGASVFWELLALYGLIQVGRVWVMIRLGRFWTTRVITLPGVALVRRGPYRYLRHPNYVVVCAEIAVLPLVFGAWHIALVFSVLNLAMLRHRIRVEDAALADRRESPAAG